MLIVQWYIKVWILELLNHQKMQENLIPHHLIDIISPEQDFDLGLFLEETEKAIKTIREKK